MLESEVIGIPELMEERQYDVAAVKERLLSYRENEREIENQSERLERLQSRMYGAGAQTITDMPRSPSPSNDRLSDMVSQKQELEGSINELVQQQRNERKAFEKILKRLKHSDEKAVIRMRYFDCLSWNDVVDMMFGGRRDFLGKEDTYLRRVHKIHGSALLNIAIYVEDSGDPNTAVFRAPKLTTPNQD